MALIAYDSTMRMAYDGWSRRAWKEEEKKREEAGLSKNRPVSVLAAVECVSAQAAEGVLGLARAGAAVAGRALFLPFARATVGSAAGGTLGVARGSGP